MTDTINAKPPQATMTIAYDKGKQVITHPSGVVSEYTATDIQKWKDNLLTDKARIEQRIIDIDKTLVDAVATAPK